MNAVTRVVGGAPWDAAGSGAAWGGAPLGFAATNESQELQEFISGWCDLGQAARFIAKREGLFGAAEEHPEMPVWASSEFRAAARDVAAASAEPSRAACREGEHNLDYFVQPYGLAHFAGAAAGALAATKTPLPKLIERLVNIQGSIDGLTGAQYGKRGAALIGAMAGALMVRSAVYLMYRDRVNPNCKDVGPLELPMRSPSPEAKVSEASGRP